MQNTNDIKSSNEESWHDITDQFKALASNLRLGELVKPDTFTLFEAMTAIELMDPKMDNGMVLKKTNREVLTFDEAIKAMKIKTNNLELEELIGIIDDTYACMATWLDGHFLSQTVMTNLYLHDPEKIGDRCLRIFCQAALKLVEIIDKLVGLVYCVEEEDFVLNNGKFKLATQLNDQKALNALADICQHYERLYNELDKSGNSTSNQHQHQHHHNSNKSKQVESSVNLASQKSNSEQQQQQQQTDILTSTIDKSQKPLLCALIVRLKFTQNFYACFLNISKNLLKDRFVVPAHNLQAQAQKIIKSVQSSTNICDQHLDICLKQLNLWKDTLDLGIKAAAAEGGKTNDDLIEGDYPTIMGFDPLVNLKTLPPAYTRLLIIKSRSSTLDYLRDILIKFKKCIEISSIFNQSKSFIKPIEAAEEFSKYFEPKSCVISRSFLQTLYLPNRITPLLKEEILHSMSDYCEPVVQLLKSDGPKFIALDEFLEDCSKLFCQIILAYGHNPVRQHEKFTEIIGNFRNLHYTSLLLSEVLTNMMVSSWTTYYFMKFCIKFVLSSLELELFSPHEYPYVFWYLYEVLLRNEKDQLEIGKKLAFTTCEQTIDTLGGNNNNGKQNIKRTKTKAKKKLNKLDSMMEIFHDKNLLLNEAMSNLINGLFLVTFGLRKQGIIRTPSFEFTDEKICFDQRFGIITGGTSVYDSYLKSTTSGLLNEQVKVIYMEAALRFSRAKKLFERCGDQNQCLAVSKANEIVATILHMNHPDTFVKRQVEFCFDKHPSLPVIKI